MPYPFQRAHMIQNIQMSTSKYLRVLDLGMFLGTKYQTSGVWMLRMVGIPGAILWRIILFHWLFSFCTRVWCWRGKCCSSIPKRQFHPKHLYISLIFSLGTTRFILGQFQHLESHGPIDWTLPGSYGAAVTRGVGKDVPTVTLPLPLRGSLRVMVDSVNDVTARWGLRL